MIPATNPKLVCFLDYWLFQHRRPERNHRDLMIYNKTLKSLRLFRNCKGCLYGKKFLAGYQGTRRVCSNCTGLQSNLKKLLHLYYSYIIYWLSECQYKAGMLIQIEISWNPLQIFQSQKRLWPLCAHQNVESIVLIEFSASPTGLI